MREILRMFKIRREERWLALVVVLVFALLNALTIYKYGDLFMRPADDYWKLFIGRFRVSGYDPITSYVLSDWETRYNVYRFNADTPDKCHAEVSLIQKIRWKFGDSLDWTTLLCGRAWRGC